MSELSPFQAGQKVGARRFTLVKPLGRGGMGEVWLAHDSHLDEPVALKFLPPEVASDSAARNHLRHETVRSHHLTHPNIIRIHDFQQSDGAAFISMEYVAGATLSDRRLLEPKQVLSWDQLAPLVQQLCAALEYAHGEGVIHRDLKPANVMLDSKGRVKLADFGIAAVVSDSVSRVSQQHSTSGTLPYMSPQQLAGKRPTATDDIYSLGATLYELLTSQPPFCSGDITHQVLHEPAEPIDERLAALGIENGVPPAVGAMVMACLAKEPARRPQSASAVAGWIGMEIVPKPSVHNVAEALFPTSPVTNARTPSSQVELEPAISTPTGKKLIAVGITVGLLVAAVAGWHITRHRPPDSGSSNRAVQSSMATNLESGPRPMATTVGGETNGGQLESAMEAATSPARLASKSDAANPADGGGVSPFRLQRPTLERRPSGRIITWGNGYGNHSPLVVPTASSQVIAISGGGFHSLALTGDGRVWASGAGSVNTGTNEDFGQSMVPPGLDHVVAISAGWQHSLALRQDGTVLGWGQNNFGQTIPPADLTNAVAIAAGAYHSVALMSDGSVRVWGLNRFGQGNTPPGLNHVVGIATGWHHVLALRSDGTVVAWGAGKTTSGKYPIYGQAVVPAGLRNVISIAAGGIHSAALKADGGLVMWGGESPEVRSVPPTTRVVAIAANGRHTLALQSDGTVIAWGQGSAGQNLVPPALNDVIAIAAGNGHSLALTTNP